MSAPRRRRLGAAIVLIAVVASGLLVTRLPDSAASDIAGDALYAAAAYVFVVVVAPRAAPVAVAAIAGGWCVAVELFQLTGLPEQWAAAFRPAMLVFGTVFDARDLAVYAAAAVVCAVLDLGIRSVAGREDPPQ